MKRLVFCLATILVVTLVSGSAFAEANINFNGIGGRLAYVSISDVATTGDSDLGSAFSFAVMADLGTITPKIGLDAYIAYWSTSDEYSIGATILTPAQTWEVKLRDIIIGARGKYLIETSNPEFKPYVGAGLSIHMVKMSSETSVSSAFDTDASNTDLALDIGGGTNYEVSPNLDLFGELWYAITDADQLSIGVGVIYWLGQSE